MHGKVSLRGVSLKEAAQALVNRLTELEREGVSQSFHFDDVAEATRMYFRAGFSREDAHERLVEIYPAHVRRINSVLDRVYGK